jgi:hypothetical protein
MINRLMDQKPIVLYFRMKEMVLDAIHNNLVRTLGKDAVSILSMRQYSRLLPNFRFRFRFRLCASFRGGSVFRDPPCICTSTGTGTSRNHFASRCDIFDGFPTFDSGTEADSGPDGNQTIVGPLGAKHVPVARQCHLEQLVDLFIQ